MMSLSRRRFLRAGSMFALAAGIPMGFASTVFGQQDETPRKILSPQPLKAPQTEPDPGYYFQYATFVPYVNTQFQARTESGRLVPLTLIEAEDRRPATGPESAEAGGAERFSLVFRGSRSTPLQQDVYPLSNDALGEFTLFIVPIISKDTKARYYEAIINRRRP